MPSPTAARTWRRIDERLLNRLNATWSTPALDAACPMLSRAADRLTIWLVLAAAISARRPLRPVAVRAVVALVVADAASTVTARWIVERPRPPAHIRSRRPGNTPDTPGFPSGHTAAATAFATTILIKGPPVIGWPVAGLATAVSLSRLYIAAHYPSDVALGAVAGVAAAITVNRRQDARAARHLS